MAFQKADPQDILNLTQGEKDGMLRAFALNGYTIETISDIYGVSTEDVTTFLDNRADEIMALKDFYTKMGGVQNDI